MTLTMALKYQQPSGAAYRQIHGAAYGANVPHPFRLVPVYVWAPAPPWWQPSFTAPLAFHRICVSFIVLCPLMHGLLHVLAEHNKQTWTADFSPHHVWDVAVGHIAKKGHLQHNCNLHELLSDWRALSPTVSMLHFTIWFSNCKGHSNKTLD